MLCNRISRHTSCMLLTRYTSTTSESKSIQPPNPKKISTDMIGPPDPVSNLRRIIFKQSVNETELEKKYREMRAEVQDWNQNFWTEHNSRFYQVCGCFQIWGQSFFVVFDLSYSLDVLLEILILIPLWLPFNCLCL